MDEIEKYKKRLLREKSARQQAEDLLEQKAADLFEKNRELLSLSDGLEKLVAERTAQMQKARDEALTALQIKSDFIANMSHELRTPMNGVLGVLGLLSDEELDSNQRELVSIAQASGEHLLMVINDVLDFSKIEADKIELEMAPVDIRAYFKGLCKPFELQTQQKGISFEYHIDEDVPSSIITDKLRLTQIITNLLSNAVKFTKQGCVSLHFGFAQPDVGSALNDNTFRLTVTDTGIGISEENIEAVFSAFEQADTSITREFGGTGLGMNITKRLVDMLNGNIFLESELGKGSTFYIDFSCEIDKQESAEAFQELHTQVIEGNARILLVEDNKINQLVAKRLLEKWGLAVSLAEDGQQAIDVLREESFDLVLMDLQMPVKGGIEAAQEIRAQHIIEPSVPIIAMTAHNSKEHINECLESGMQGHVSKPIDKAYLKGVIAQFLESIVNNDNTQEEERYSISATIEGVDLNDGLARLNGDWTLLHTLIGNFLQEHKSLKAHLGILQQAKQFDDAMAVLHKIKGSGGNLGLVELAGLAAKAENKLKNEEFLSQDEIDALDATIHKVSEGFAAIENPETAKASPAMRSESADYVLQKMDEVLQNLSKDMLASEEALQDLLLCKLDKGIAQHVIDANEAMQRFDILHVENTVKQAKAALAPG